MKKIRYAIGAAMAGTCVLLVSPFLLVMLIIGFFISCWCEFFDEENSK